MKKNIWHYIISSFIIFFIPYSTFGAVGDAYQITNLTISSIDASGNTIRVNSTNAVCKLFSSVSADKGKPAPCPTSEGSIYKISLSNSTEIRSPRSTTTGKISRLKVGDRVNIFGTVEVGGLKGLIIRVIVPTAENSKVQFDNFEIIRVTGPEPLEDKTKIAGKIVIAPKLNSSCSLWEGDTATNITCPNTIPSTYNTQNPSKNYEVLIPRGTLITDRDRYSVGFAALVTGDSVNVYGEYRGNALGLNLDENNLGVGRFVAETIRDLNIPRADSPLSISVLNPKNFENLVLGSPYNILLSYNQIPVDQIPGVKLYLYLKDKRLGELVGTAQNSGSFVWDTGVYYENGTSTLAKAAGNYTIGVIPSGVLTPVAWSGKFNLSSILPSIPVGGTAPITINTQIFESSLSGLSSKELQEVTLLLQGLILQIQSQLNSNR